MLPLNGQSSSHEQEVYRLMGIACGVAFTLGLLWVLLGFNDNAPGNEPDWQSTRLITSGDPREQFNVLSAQPRWFEEISKRGRANSKSRSRVKEDPFKALEGKPESFRLTGIVHQGEKRYALFLPLIVPSGSTVKPITRQLAEGDTLVGEWRVKHIGSNQVDVQQGEDVQSLKMYQPKSK